MDDPITVVRGDDSVPVIAGPPLPSALAYRSQQVTCLAGAGVAIGGAAVVYLAARWWPVPVADAVLVVPALYATAVLGAAVCAFLLSVRARVLDDGQAAWLAAGFALTGVAVLAEGLGIARLADTAFGPSPSAAAALFLLWHLILPGFAAAGLLFPDGTRVRWGASCVVGLLVALIVWEPTWASLPALVDGSDVLSPRYHATLRIVASLGVAATALWLVRAGRRPTRVQACVAVALCLLALDAALASGTPRAFAAIWWSALTVRSAAFAFPAAGLLIDAGRRLHQLHRHERSLIGRIQREFELAARIVDPVVPDPEARRRIEAALEPGGLRSVYQPIYSLVTGELAAVEALARFRGVPARPPDLWFAEAHAVGLGAPLELAAIRAALDGATVLPPNVALAVNVSPEVLVRPEVTELFAALDRPLVLEITEHAAVDDYQRLSEVLTTLRASGVRLAIDDAGAGFASMRHIVRLVPDIIKLDMSLTHDLHRDPVRRSLATSLVGFAEQIGALVVAEGIEERDELLAWQQLGAHAGQGFLLGRPGQLPAAMVCDAVPAPDLPIAHRR